MSKFKTFDQFVNEQNHNTTGQFNRSEMENNFVGALGNTFNKKESVKSKEDVDKILKERDIKWSKQTESRNGWIHYRYNTNWSNYNVGIDPITGKNQRAKMVVAAYNPHDKVLWTEPTDVMKDYNKAPHISETVGTIDAPVYDESPEEFPEIAIEKKDSSQIKFAGNLAKLLKELYTTALNCDYDGHKIKETLYPKYKGTKTKMNITEEGKFMFDTFGRFPDVSINLKNMKKGEHDESSIKEEIKKHIKKITERISGMPSMSQIASFDD